MSYQVRDCYLPLILAEPKILPCSNTDTDKVTDKDLLLATVAPVVPVVMAAASLSHRPLAPLLAPTPSMFNPYPRPPGIEGSKPRLADQRLDFKS